MRQPNYKIIAGSILLLFTQPVLSEDEVVDVSGISIIGNRELPKSLFIVPWKNADVGDNTELTDTLDEGLRPIDREVFVREVEYYHFLQGDQ